MSQASSSPPGAGVGSHGAARGEHGDDQRVRPGEQFVDLGPAARSDEQYTHRALPPAACTASASASTKAVFPDTACAR